MKNFLKFNAYQQNKKLSLIFLSVFVIFTILASIIGISDNPPGIILLYIGTASLILSFTHHWRSSRKYLIFLGVTIATFVISAILHNVLDGVADQYISIALIKSIVGGLGVVFFLLAVIICPPALVISIIGAVRFALKKNK